MTIEKELNVLEDSLNLIIKKLNEIPKHAELSEIVDTVDKQLLDLKQRVTTAQYKLAIIEKTINSIS